MLWLLVGSHLLTNPLHVVPDTLNANQILIHESHQHPAPVYALGSVFIHHPTNLGNHKAIFPHQFHFFFFQEGGERKNENANKLWQVAINVFHPPLAKPRPDTQLLQTTSMCLHPR